MQMVRKDHDGLDCEGMARACFTKRLTQCTNVLGQQTQPAFR